jgi:hydrogenase maturation protein HypF
MVRRKHIHVDGIVQGVGFRPFVYRLAQGLNLTGYVRNTTEGVDIEVEGQQADVQRFVCDLTRRKPKAAVIDRLEVSDTPRRRTATFIIRKSARREGFTRIAPDIATCNDCLHEMADPEDRRYLYPFINCTNCGPRFSIIRKTPYDRSQTSMRSFDMCEQCAAEFKDVLDRRFHAQPDCCVECGPRFVLIDLKTGFTTGDDTIIRAIRLLMHGKIIAIKGIGGFHLACDATNTRSITRLRAMKQRPTKPLAVMCDLAHARRIARISEDEASCLLSSIAPIVIVQKKANTIISDHIAPGNPYIGIMTPYAPVHHLLIKNIPYCVMTSGNIRDEPIVKDDEDMRHKLHTIASHALTHDRDIENRCDDSVGFVYPDRGFSIIRRSRGFVPSPVALPDRVPPMLALGPHLKNTFCLARAYEAYVSPHIGDLDNMENLVFFNEMVEKYRTWFRIDPELVVHDMHPEYLSTRIAPDFSLPTQAVQHHVAHIVSCLGEHGVRERAIGIAFDGTGYGLDKRIWGGEFFIGDCTTQQRVAHLEYIPLPGGEASITRPYRIAIAYAATLCGSVFRPRNIPAKEVRSVLNILNDRQFTVETSSMGRLFDCVAGMIGLVKEITYEAEGAINLEHIAKKGVKAHYPYTLLQGDPVRIGIAPVIDGVMHDLSRDVSLPTISAKFHNTIVHFSLEVVKKMSTIHHTRSVCLSGGVFQNRRLLTTLVRTLERNAFNVYVHKRLPTNDGCISYGQVVYANNQRMRNKQKGTKNVH